MTSIPSTPLTPVQLPQEARVREEDGKVTINTGKGDDKVAAFIGEDGMVHVKVNGEEVWSGSKEDLEKLVINTGAGNDSVFNGVDGARIHTGRGDDRVFNIADGARIRTGRGEDSVVSLGRDNNIFLGLGDDRALSLGRGGHTLGGPGQDRVHDPEPRPPRKMHG
jgi:hypothetical protein